MAGFQKAMINLSKGQMKDLAKAMQLSAPVTLRISAKDLTGNVPILLTKRQHTKLLKMKKLNKGMQIRFSKNQILKMKKDGGIAPIFAALIPALIPLITKGISALVKKIKGGQVGNLPLTGNRGLDTLSKATVTQSLVQNPGIPFKNGTVNRSVDRNPSQFVGTGRMSASQKKAATQIRAAIKGSGLRIAGSGLKVAGRGRHGNQKNGQLPFGIGRGVGEQGFRFK